MGQFTPEQATQAFLIGQPVINQQIKNLTVQHPSWLEGQYALEPWTAEGAMMEELSYRGSLPQIEHNFDKWKKVNAPVGCNPCEADNCGYNWTQFGGSALERKIITLMARDFRSQDFCVKEIASTAQFEMLFTQFVQDMYMQLKFFKEVNIGLNFMQQITKKFVVDSDGAKGNPVNPYIYRNIGAARLSNLNITLLEFVYEQLRNRADTIPYDVVDGSPVFALEASAQLLSRLYRDDPALRQDARWSDEASNLLKKYNFMSTIRGMFIPAAIQFPRRANFVGGEPVFVEPYINGVKSEAGEFTDLNPAWHLATHEEVTVHGMHPFKVYHKGTPTTLGADSNFGPEDSFMDKWRWSNVETPSDPDRRVGFYHTSATIALSSQYSGGCFAFLVERPSQRLMFSTSPDPICPTTPPVCNNSVPEVACPCPLIVDIQANPMVVNQYFITFATAITGEVEQAVNLMLDNGGVVTGVLTAISTDHKTAAITFAGGLDRGVCAHVVSIACLEVGVCSSTVQLAEDCRSGETDAVRLVLTQKLLVAVGDEILVYFGDCTTAMLEITAIDAANNSYTVQYAAGYGPTDDPAGEGQTNLSADMICDRSGVVKVCVPPSTNIACPACTPSVAACVYPRQPA